MKFRRVLSISILSALISAGSFISVQADDLTSLASPVARGPQSKESVYFVMIDRFANGDTSNDEAGISGGRLGSGFDPSDPGWWHGGDFKGLTDHLPYIKDLGFTSIWITPPVKQQYIQGDSAAYHGYWGLNFETVDPHLGTEVDFRNLVSRAHELGLKVILDVVANHTADVIKYKFGFTNYRDTSSYPYRTSKGKPFDPSKYAGLKTFPKLSAIRSFAYTPNIPAAYARIKRPAWLNDVTNYHNRGDSTFSGESSLDGDFFGLDDLFTEKPAVINGWITVWSDWITKFNIDGLRIDTFKHVNPEFWHAVIPKVLAVAKSAGKEDFPIYGEVSDSDPYTLATYVGEHQTPSVLDFAFQKVVSNYARYGMQASKLADLFNADDAYTTSSTSAYGLATFLGNHDMGRIGMMLNDSNSGGEADVLLERAKLANALLFLLRGGPVLYYGDEKGMTGSGGDKAARQDMFATQVEDWKTETRIGGVPIGNASSFDSHNPLEDQIKELQGIIKENPVLRNGAQQTRFADSSIFAASRFGNNQEYIIAFNDAGTPQTASFSVATAGVNWKVLAGNLLEVSTSSKKMSIKMQPRSYVALKADRLLVSSAKLSISLRSPVVDFYTPHWLSIMATVPGNDFNEVTFAARVVGRSWKVLGTSDHRTFKTGMMDGGTYRVFLHPRDYKSGTKLEIVAIAKSASGEKIASKIQNTTIAY
ncbi:MAG: alpha-amylase family glycosyl hydrolase [Candidatus Nanopelagicaceae bacterium]|nr:alpha-amylase family glycosyl hydrolase [Candidatus Nanopelagicaceae bacterium]